MKCPFPQEGTDIWVPRTQAILDAVHERWGWAARFVGVYGQADGCGGCTDFAMNSDNYPQRAHWTTVGPKTGAPATPWFMRRVPYTEPNGNYASGCWYVPLSCVNSWRHRLWDDPGHAFYFTTTQLAVSLLSQVE